MMKGGAALLAGYGAGPIGALPTSSFWLGKGLKEPCAPNREVVVFGAELNAVPTVIQWNCNPAILGQTNTFNLSELEPNHEVALALAVLQNLQLSAPLAVKIEWYHKGATLFTFDYSIPAGTYAWYGVFSYIGYVPTEISENGDYTVALFLNGENAGVAPFAVTGIGGEGATGMSKWIWAGVAALAAALVWSKLRK